MCRRVGVDVGKGLRIWNDGNDEIIDPYFGIWRFGSCNSTSATLQHIVPRTSKLIGPSWPLGSTLGSYLYSAFGCKLHPTSPPWATRAGSRRAGSSRDDVDLHRLKFPTQSINFTPHSLLLGSLTLTHTYRVPRSYSATTQYFPFGC
jgi:hypothetical protein